LEDLGYNVIGSRVEELARQFMMTMQRILREEYMIKLLFQKMEK